MSIILDLKKQEPIKQIIKSSESSNIVNVKNFKGIVSKIKDKIKNEVKEEVEGLVRNITRDEVVKMRVPTYVMIKNNTNFSLFHIILLIMILIVIIIVVKKVKDKFYQKNDPESN